MEQGDGIDGHETSGTVYDIGTHPFVVYSCTILRAIRREQALLASISQKGKLETEMTRSLVTPSIESWITQGELLYGAAVQRNCVGIAGLSVFDVVLFFYEKSKELLESLHVANYQLLLRLHQVANSFADLGRRSLIGFPRSIQGDDLRKVPSDGTVHELTSTTLRFVTALHDYHHVAGGLLHESFQVAKELTLQPEELCEEAMSSWLNDVVTDLVDNITRKGKTFEDPTLTAVFLMNNFDYIRGYLLSSPYAALLRRRTPAIEADFRQKVLEQQQLYCESTWGTLAEILRDNTPARTGSVNVPVTLAKKDRETIKDLYTRFNTLVESTFTSQREYAVPNGELRAQLRANNIEHVVPPYKAFDTYYRNSDFSRKNPEKYLKFTPEELAQKMQNEMFGAA
jgi:exocyst complex protein 7